MNTTTAMPAKEGRGARNGNESGEGSGNVRQHSGMAEQPRLFRNRNFLWLFGGSAISMLGDQFTLIAFPWLVLQLTHDPLALGVVLTLMGIPRALFILAGGAIVDRYSPRLVLVLTKLGNAILLGLLAALVAGGALSLPMIYALALMLGLLSAFSMPAGNSILPQVVPPALLQSANGAVMGVRQLTSLLGPVVAGSLIAFSGTAAGLSDRNGLAASFAIDAASFAVALCTLFRVRMLASAAPDTKEGMVQAIMAALRLFWADRALRTLCLYFAAIACFVAGPISVALPVLAATQLAGGAASLGMLLTGHGIGVVAGMALAGMRPHLRLGTLGATMLAFDALSGLAFMPLGHIGTAWQGVALLAPLGGMAGFIQIAVYTWMQKRIPPPMMGRFMSLFMFIFMGLTPVASAAAGALLKLMTPAVLFTGAGIALVAIATLGACFTGIVKIDEAPAARP
jgi:hypothetical protein